MLEHENTAFAHDVARRVEDAVDRRVVGRIEERYIEPVGDGSIAQRFERPLDARADNNTPIRDPAVSEILFDERLRAAIAFDEGDGSGAAADRFDAERAGAGIRVEHARARNARRENVEDRLAQLVRRRPEAVPRRRVESSPLQRSGDDPHCGRRVQTAPAYATSICRVQRDPAYPTSINLNRLSQLSSSRATAAGVGAADSNHAVASRCATSSSSRSRTRSTSRNVGMPACRVPKKSPGPRSSKSRSAISKPSVVSVVAFRRSRASSDSGDWYKRKQYDWWRSRPTRPRSWCSCDNPNRSACSTIMTLAFDTSMPTSTTVVETRI